MNKNPHYLLFVSHSPSPPPQSHIQWNLMWTGVQVHSYHGSQLKDHAPWVCMHLLWASPPLRLLVTDCWGTEGAGLKTHQAAAGPASRDLSRTWWLTTTQLWDPYLRGKSTGHQVPRSSPWRTRTLKTPPHTSTLPPWLPCFLPLLLHTHFSPWSWCWAKENQ